MSSSVGEMNMKRCFLQPTFINITIQQQSKNTASLKFGLINGFLQKTTTIKHFEHHEVI
jgi:hypothetical protein